VASSKPNIHRSYTLDDYFISYKEYTKNNPAYNVTQSKFFSVIKDYFKFLSKELILESKEIRLPARMGTLYVEKRKPKKYNSDSLRVDFKSTRELGKLVLHLNEHSDGYNYSFHWNKKDILLKNKSLYELIMTRANKRRLAKAIKEDRKDYIER